MVCTVSTHVNPHLVDRYLCIAHTSSQSALKLCIECTHMCPEKIL